MKLLLDTHVLIWLAEGDEQLPESSVRAIDDAAQANGLVVSPISFWECAMLAARGRVSLSQSVLRWRQRILDAGPIDELPMTGEIAIESVLLPDGLHKDPADRLLVATARTHGLVLGTRDARLLAYGKQGHVNVRRL